MHLDQFVDKWIMDHIEDEWSKLNLSDELVAQRVAEIKEGVLDDLADGAQDEWEAVLNAVDHLLEQGTKDIHSPLFQFHPVEPPVELVMHNFRPVKKMYWEDVTSLEELLEPVKDYMKHHILLKHPNFGDFNEEEVEKWALTRCAEIIWQSVYGGGG